MKSDKKDNTIKFIGYTPKPHQREVHNYITKIGPHAGQIIAVKAKRQVGKSILCEQELLRHAIQYNSSVSICLSLTYASVSKIYKEMIQGLRNSGVVEHANNSDLTIEFINGSQIIFKSIVSRENLRGFTVKNGGILVLDEAAYWNDEIFNIVAPYVDVSHANILMVSTPRRKTGFFYDYYTIGLTDAAPNVKSFDMCKYDLSEFLSNEKLELYRKVMPIGQFTSEYLGQFIDEYGSVFKMSANVWKTYVISERHTHEYNAVYLGIDWAAGKGGDYTAIVGLDENKNQIVLDYVKDKDPMEQIEWATKIINRLHDVKTILCEENSLGSVYISALKKALPYANIVEFTTSNSSKREIIENLAAAIGNEEITLLKEAEEYQQFGNYEVEVTKSGKITYNGALGTHDDIVMATAFALKAFMESANQYNVVYATHGSHKNNYRNKYR